MSLDFEHPFGEFVDLKAMAVALGDAIDMIASLTVEIADLKKEIQSMTIEKMAPTGAFLPRNRRFG